MNSAVPGGRVLDEVRWATEVLGSAGVETPRADAAWLMAHLLGVEPGRLAVIDRLDEAQREQFERWVHRRASRVPLQHITGTAAFGPVELAVGPGVFVPRPETELLLEWALTACRSAGPHPVVADLCSGSGALALAVATLAPNARVYAVEADARALVWLRRNVAEAAGISQRIEVVEADVTDTDAVTRVLPAGGIDVVMSNPPYVPAGAPTPAEVEFDPARAVFAGPDGLAVIGPMVRVIEALLTPDGRLGIEHDDTTATAVREALESCGAFTDIASHRDLADRPRFVTARRHLGDEVPGLIGPRARMNR